MHNLKKLIVLFTLCAAKILFAQTISDTLIQTLQQSRYVYIYKTTVANYAFDPKSKSGENLIASPEHVRIHLDMGEKSFDHEHGKHLTFYINDKPTLRYNPEIPDDYEVMVKYAPVFNNHSYYIECPIESMQFVDGMLDLWQTNYDKKTFSESLDTHADMLESLSMNFVSLENKHCKLVQKKLN